MKNIFDGRIKQGYFEARNKLRLKKKRCHFDCSTSLMENWKKVCNSEFVKKHAFFPLIHYEKKIKKANCSTIKNKIENGVQIPIKVRSINYASHIDSCIYTYYTALLNEIYNRRIRKDKTEACVKAYRTDLNKKCNIHFAFEAFAFMRKQTDCYIVVGDFEKFFDNIYHGYLRERMIDLIEQDIDKSLNKLPDDIFAVFKSITKYACVELKDLVSQECKKLDYKNENKINCNCDECPSRKCKQEIESKIDKYDINRIRELEKKDKINLIHYNKDNFGIPQGTTISALCANIYMIEFDKIINNYVKSLGGKYMRYSDDFMIILPYCENFLDHYNFLKQRINDIDGNFSTVNKLHGLSLQEEKTSIYRFRNSDERPFLKCCTSEFVFGQADKKNEIEYLGFVFDGIIVDIKAKTYSKYYSRSGNKIKTIIKQRRRNLNPGVENLYKKYSRSGEHGYDTKYSKRRIAGNFIAYVRKSNNIEGYVNVFSFLKMHKFLNNHMKRLGQKLKKE